MMRFDCNDYLHDDELPMMFGTIAVVLLLIISPTCSTGDLLCTYVFIYIYIYIYKYISASFTYWAVLWTYFPFGCQTVFRKNSVSNLTRTVHVHVSSKDAHVLAVAGRQTVAVHFAEKKSCEISHWR